MENDQIKANSFAKIADIGKCNERAYYYETKAEMGNLFKIIQLKKEQALLNLRYYNFKIYY